MRAITRTLTGLTLALVLAACGGGGGGGGGESPDDDPPEDRLRIVETDPTDGEHFVGQDDEIVVSFSDALDVTTLEGNVRIVGPEGTVPATGTLEDTDRTLVIEPTDRLALASDYTVVLGAAIASRDGETLRKDRSFSFRTVLSPTPRIPRPEDFRILASLAVGRSYHTATLLDDGGVIVVGGFREENQVTPTAEIYDSEEKVFEPGPLLSVGRARHTATRLEDGRVLIVGGESIRNLRAVAECELYDPTTGLFEPAGVLEHARTNHRAALLDDGRVVVFGGTEFDDFDGPVSLDSAEVFDPATGAWSELSAPMVRGRTLHTATTLEDGRILIAGGALEDQSAEIFDPATMTFARTAGDMLEWRFGHNAVLLEDGFVLMSGGGAAQAEIYEPTTGLFLETSNGLRSDRFRATATPIPDGGVLVIGGIDFGRGLILDTLDVFARSQAPSGAFFQVGFTLREPLAAHTATTLEDGTILFAGGINTDTTQSELSSVTLFDPD